ncbi:MAG: sugar ABC transporter substrate-binding protein [Firmicutes bacterium]|nr:sugar ABC transporter substrate-binding protein [Bacillota bacterium]
MFKRTMLVVVCLAVMASLLAGCSQGSKPAAKQREVVLIVKNLVNPVWVDCKKAAEEAGAKLGIKVTTLAPTKPDNNEEQLRAIEDSIAKKVDAILLIPADTKGIVPGVEKANAAGIPVFLLGSPIPGGKIVTLIAVDNVEAARSVTDAMAKKLGGKGKAIILDGVPGSQSAEDLHKGMMEALKNYPEIVVLTSQTAKFQRAEAMKVMEDLLQRYPDVTVVFGANDEMALGAIEAIDAAKKSGQIAVSGLDANADACKAVDAGKMLMTCDKGWGRTGAIGVEQADKYFKGEKIPERILVPTAVVDKSNVDKFLKK